MTAWMVPGLVTPKQELRFTWWEGKTPAKKSWVVIGKMRTPAVPTVFLEYTLPTLGGHHSISLLHMNQVQDLGEGRGFSLSQGYSEAVLPSKSQSLERFTMLCTPPLNSRAVA